jgi:hypothetical protein
MTHSIAWLQDEMTKSFENSEHHLYKNYLLELGEQYEAALKHLETVQKQVLDIQAWKEAKGDLHSVDSDAGKNLKR